MKIQILHHRDPDSECGIAVYIDGDYVVDVEIVDIDPGRGYDDDSIKEMREHAQSKADASDATGFDRDVAAAYDDARFERYSL